jgi:hypothetical protein
VATSKKGSRNINVDGHDFKWRATGNDGWISIVVWPVSNEDSRVIASIDYHHDMKQVGEGHYTSQSQLVVTNRILRELILHVGVDKILENHGQLNIGRIEKFYDASKAIRG